MSDIYYVDGRFVPAEEAVLPLNDLGILRGYAIFDFLRTYSGRPIFARDHIRRLFRSAGQLGLALPWTEPELLGLVEQTLARNRHPESGVRLLVTGGPSADFITPLGSPRLAIMATALRPLPEALYRDGASVVTVPHQRHLPGAKSTDYIRAILALAEARRRQAIEALYTDAEGWVTEGTTSNVFAVAGGRLATPEEGILPGITREKVLALAAAIVPVDRRRIARRELLAAEEVFITSSSRMIVPIARIDGEPVGAGRPGPVTRRLMEVFEAFTRRLAAAGREP